MLLQLKLKFSGTIALRRPLKARCARFIVLKAVELPSEPGWSDRRKDFTECSDGETEACVQKLVGVNFRK
jgi:hypothetical protein